MFLVNFGNFSNRLDLDPMIRAHVALFKQGQNVIHTLFWVVLKLIDHSSNLKFIVLSIIMISI